MKIIFDERQALHAPERELHNGSWADYAETPARAADILRALPEATAPSDFGLEPILQVHDPAYVAFLQTAHELWVAAGRTGDAIPYTFPIVGRRPLDLSRIDGRLGAYSFDASTPVAAGTWASAYWSAQTALTALDALAVQGQRHAFALCRPPGHHAGRDYMGGYCYLNNAAIAAAKARSLGLGPVAILDVDYHHGNGTQDIFYDDPELFFVSIHADPASDYPYYWGRADERGGGAGEGATRNLPLPRLTGIDAYRRTLAEALGLIADRGTRFLVISFGADTYAGDPISHFKLATEDFATIGRDIAGLGLPSLVVMEGGYAIDALGANVGAFLSGFAN